MDSHHRIRLVDRLHFRIALFVILTIVLIFGLFSVYQLWTYQDHLTSSAVAASQGLCQTLTSSLEIAMLHNDLRAIQYSFDAIARQKGITRVLLLNRDQRVRAASPLDLIGERYRRDDPGCRECHDGSSKATYSTTLSEEAGHILRVVSPVANKPACFGCHGDSAAYNGILILDRSLEPVRQQIFANMRLAGMAAGGSVLLMMFLFRWYIKRQVISRVVYLESLARKVVDHEFSPDIELSGRDELASLAISVNYMRQSLKQSIERIDGHRSYLAHLLENLTDGIVILDAHGHVVFVNKAVTRVLELPASTLSPGDRLDGIEAGKERLASIGILVERAQARQTSVNEVVRLSWPQDREKYLEIHIRTLIWPARSEPELIIVMRDITARMDFERQVYQSEKLVTVGQLAAGVAHEINNPMASILTCAEGLLRQEQPASSEQREYLDIIRNSARRCKVITQKLLDYAAAPTLVMAQVELQEVLNEAMDLLQFEGMRKGIRLTLDVPDGTTAVRGSKDALIQVFVNLILNSLEAVTRGGYVEVEVVARPDSVDVYVHDNGSGIDAEHAARVFDPFFTTKPVGTSSGLGLSVSQGIVKQHGGAITIVKRGVHRTSVKVSLPAITGRTEGPS